MHTIEPVSDITSAVTDDIRIDQVGDDGKAFVGSADWGWERDGVVEVSEFGGVG